MISYREKELLMVMKMLQEETEHTTSHMQSVLRSMNTKEKQISIINTDSRMCETYDELVDLRRFVLDIFANGINTLSMFTFIETDIFLFHVLLQVRLPHYQPTVLLTWKLLMALIQ